MPSTFLVTSSDEFEEAARVELQRYDPKLKPGQSLAPGLFLVKSAFAADDFAAIAVQNPPIYARHFFPVMATVPLFKTEADLESLAQAVQALPLEDLLNEQTTFAIQARLAEEESGEASAYPYSPFRIKEVLAQLIAERTSAVENIREPQVVLSVVCVKDNAYLGISLAELNLSNWAGGMRRFAKRPAQISRAELKLQEALEIFGIELPTSGHALDLGAAPGGWTRLLLEAGMQVTAIDPALLDPRISEEAYPNKLVHYKNHAEQFLRENLETKTKYDLIASDVRMDAPMAARLVVSYKPLLAPNGFAITTLKLPHESTKYKPAVLAEQALAILRQAYPHVQARQLFHNRQEITVFLKPRKS